MSRKAYRHEIATAGFDVHHERTALVIMCFTVTGNIYKIEDLILFAMLVFCETTSVLMQSTCQQDARETLRQLCAVIGWLKYFLNVVFLGN